ncbi:MAG: aminoglycoside phosphotransferase family protein [Ruminococcaceae bacterium]|nr:aminoglycoside phosphotransferase family protein [Oscillospiraceae bacterium]
MEKKLFCIAEGFLPTGAIRSIAPLGIGNINDSFLAEGEEKYVLQRINTDVFTDPVGVMQNIQLVCAHLEEKIKAEGGNPWRESLQFLPTRADGTLLYIAEDGTVWRMYRFVDDVVTLQNAASPDAAYKAALAFGQFQSRLADFDATRLVETIPDFHNTKKRWDVFCKAVDEDRANRALEVKDLIKTAERLSYLAPALTGLVEKGELPVRVTHNDTKINNVLFDKTTGNGICVIDLDTVMPATALYDFGDMVRSGANATDEEDTDLSRVSLDMAYYAAFLRGFLDGTGGRLTRAEKENLAQSALVITFELAIRFLGDYLNGDVYFSIRTPRHNAQRAANQLQLVCDMEKKYEAMQKMLDTI